MMTEIDLGDRSNGYTNSAFTTEENLHTNSNGVSNGKSEDGSPNGIKNGTGNGLHTKVAPYASDNLEDGTYCGYFFWKPTWLQIFRSPKVVLFFMCCAAAVQGMAINGFVNVSISTIEKRYHLKSSTTGLIAGSYDIACVLCSIPVSYLGSRFGASKPRWIGWGILVMGMGSFVFSLPHFMIPLYNPVYTTVVTNSSSICLPQEKISDSSLCDVEGDLWLQNYKYVFILGSLLHGVGASPLYTLGTAYLDESVPVKMSSMYLGIYHTMSVIGPAIGYVAGGRFLSVFIDAPVSDPESVGIEVGGSLWLGAWWVGFLIAGTTAFAISWILIMFPRQLPGFEERAVSREAASHLSDSSHAFADLKSLPQQLKLLLTNWPYVFISLGESVEGLMMSGFATFIPKLIESQFSVSPGFASIVVGCVTVPAGGGGTFLGGWLVKRFKLDCRGITKMISIFSFICCCFCATLFLSCPNQRFAGVNQPYVNQPKLMGLNLSSECNSGCSCSDLTYDPVCGTDRVFYYSPCHAGCKSTRNENGDEIFYDCSCISDERNLSVEDSSVGMLTAGATREPCGEPCHLFTPFLVLLFIVMFLIFLVTMPSVIATLRSVHDSQRSIALGVQGIALRVLGTIPGPIIFGTIIDNTCVLWQSTCDGSGACRSYDNAQLSKSIMGFALGLRLTTTVCYMTAWYLFSRKSKVAPS